MVSVHVPSSRKKATPPASDLLLYSEMSRAEIRAAQRRLAAGELHRIAAGVVTARPEEDWPALIARERIRVMAALFPNAVIGPRTAFDGGGPNPDGVVYLTYTYMRAVPLPGLTIQLVDGPGPAAGPPAGG